MDSTTDLRLLIVGKSGSGKSSTGNTILGEKKFEVHEFRSFSSRTQQCEVATGRHGYTSVQVMDTPGFFDTQLAQEDTARRITESLRSWPEGPDAVVIVIAAHQRYSREDYAAYETLKQILGENVTEYSVIVFTGGDIREHKQIEHDIFHAGAPAGLRRVLKECDNRYIVINNKAAEEVQVERLLDVIRNVKKPSFFRRPKSGTLTPSLFRLTSGTLTQSLFRVLEPAMEREKYHRGIPPRVPTQETATTSRTSTLFTQSDKEGEMIRLLLVGKTGSGKSTTGNTIFGGKLFDTDVNCLSVTTTCSLKRKETNGKVIEIMDCPGLYDTSKTQEETSTVIIQAMACMHPGPHAVLYVVKLGRYTAEEYGVYQRLKALFDDTITDYIIVLFTGGDELERRKKTLEDLLQNAPEHLKIVLKECGNRCVVFNNLAADPQPQVDRLFEMIRQMKHANGKPYSCPKYANIGESMEQEIARRLAVVEKMELERQKYVQELQKKTEAAEEELRKQKEENEKKEQERQRQLEEDIEKLKKLMEEQKMSEERRRQEEKAFNERLERKRQQLLLQMEEQQRKDREEMERLEKNRAELEECLKEEIEARERERLRYMKSLKDTIART